MLSSFLAWIVHTDYTFINVLTWINHILGIIMLVLYANQFVYIVLSIFVKPRRYKVAKTEHTYGYIICGRNEEKVIGNLIDSILKQDYPKEKMHIFVCADNCTDNTAKVAREAGAIVFEREDHMQVGKSYALNYTLDKIKNEYSELGIEAYILFDADNLVGKDFTKEMNKAYDQGYKVLAGFRDSKNFDDSWVSAGSSYMFYRECCQVHKVRSFFNTGSYVSGTGFLVDKSLVENGWNYHTLTEDIEFSADCAYKGIKIGYVYDAVFFDEQPTKLGDSIKQRLRWCKGNNQVFGRFGGKLLGGMFKRFTFQKWSMFTHTIPVPAISTIWICIFHLAGGIYCLANHLPSDIYIKIILSAGLSTIFAPFVSCFIDAILLLIQTYKRTSGNFFKRFLYACGFVIFIAIYIPITVVALFKKNVTWKQIPHKDTRTIEKI